eukprot:TRINITY_DN13132_c0_g1_i1.p1 TRINITY_DN13132_c0_g1~~TRINITY_DN13132_c0_g1_i1.p1  ORF type:complete len:199 (-),score=34.62 TRINITY_DN13132_c0_g1_i1:79-675(-)
MCSNDPSSTTSFGVTLSNTTYALNQKLTLLVSSSVASETFEGLFCYASIGTISRNFTNIIGVFDTPDPLRYKFTDDTCPTPTTFSVTHSDASPKSNATFVWNAPATNVGQIQMNCILVFSRASLNCQYRVYKVLLNGPPVPPTTATPIAPVVPGATSAPFSSVRPTLEPVTPEGSGFSVRVFWSFLFVSVFGVILLTL